TCLVFCSGNNATLWTSEDTFVGFNLAEVIVVTGAIRASYVLFDGEKFCRNLIAGKRTSSLGKCKGWYEKEQWNRRKPHGALRAAEYQPSRHCYSSDRRRISQL